MINLKEVLTEYAEHKNYKLRELDGGKFSIDIAMKLKDGSFRYQFVWIWISPNRGKGKDCVYFTSRAGAYTPNVNLYQLIRESGYGIYTTVTIVSDKDKEGNPCETVVVQASPVHEHLSKEQFLYILWEVAEVADILEEKHFGGDSH
ncbi:hypothetical protein [Aureispira anguillae]|uniref:Uncharacterized protein n=1 Tax=Aureispira anguillae TaxID=2864201 RepID=A0A916DUU3_9BACT|nr:hypothetical protein [Aureispira anguillae]BDS13671.1 hypothetical protein AsAng_0044120 [Aureispira anguillae]